MGVKLQTTHCLTRCQKFGILDAWIFIFTDSDESFFSDEPVMSRGEKFCLFETIRTCRKLLPQLILSTAGLCPAASYCFSSVIYCWEIDFPRVRGQACLREPWIRKEMTDSSLRCAPVMNAISNPKQGWFFFFFCSRIYPASLSHLPLGLSVILATWPLQQLGNFHKISLAACQWSSVYN